MNDESVISELNNSLQKVEARDMFDDISEAALIKSDDDLDNANHGRASSRLGAKKDGQP